MAERRFLTAADLATETRLSARWFTAMAAAGKIPGACQPAGPRGAWRFEERAFRRWWEANGKRLADRPRPARRQSITQTLAAVIASWERPSLDEAISSIGAGKPAARPRFLGPLPDDGTFVYFVRAGEKGPIKVGKARNVTNRIRSLQTAQPKKLTLLGAVCGGAALEQFVLHKFAHLQIKGEWLRPRPELLAFIVRVCRS